MVVEHSRQKPVAAPSLERNEFSCGCGIASSNHIGCGKNNRVTTGQVTFPYTKVA